MLLKFKTCAAGPSIGVIQPGQEVDVPDDQAKDFIEGRFAEPVDQTPSGKRKRESAAMKTPRNAALPSPQGKVPAASQSGNETESGKEGEAENEGAAKKDA